jgi:hypothetical protein
MATPNSTFRPRDEAGDHDLEVGGDFCDLDLDLSFRPSFRIHFIISQVSVNDFA